MADLDRIKRENNIVELLESHGIETVGDKICCLWHDDEHPSCMINEGDVDTYYCFSCGASGSYIDMYARLNGLSFGESVRAIGGGAPELSFKEIAEKFFKKKINYKKEAMKVAIRISKLCRGEVSKLVSADKLEEIFIKFDKLWAKFSASKSNIDKDKYWKLMLDFERRLREIKD